MALLSAVATDPHRLNEIAREFHLPYGEIELSLSTIQKTIVFLPDKLVLLSCADILGRHSDYFSASKKSVEQCQIEKTSDGFAVGLKAGAIDIRVRVTDQTAIARLRTWLGRA